MLSRHPMQPLDFAKKIVLKAGDFLKKHSSGRKSIVFKDDLGSNIVTDMDHASEEMIVKAIRREFPDHAIVAEESGLSGNSPHKWYIDPVDGTMYHLWGEFPERPLSSATIAWSGNSRRMALTIISSDAWSMSVTMLLPMSSLNTIDFRPELCFLRKSPALRTIFFAKSRGCMGCRD